MPQVLYPLVQAWQGRPREGIWKAIGCLDSTYVVSGEPFFWRTTSDTTSVGRRPGLPLVQGLYDEAPTSVHTELIYATSVPAASTTASGLTPLALSSSTPPQQPRRRPAPQPRRPRPKPLPSATSACQCQGFSGSGNVNNAGATDRRIPDSIAAPTRQSLADAAHHFGSSLGAGIAPYLRCFRG